jgi:hypothetical protein
VGSPILWDSVVGWSLNRPSGHYSMPFEFRSQSTWIGYAAWQACPFRKQTTGPAPSVVSSPPRTAASPYRRPWTYQRDTPTVEKETAWEEARRSIKWPAFARYINCAAQRWFSVRHRGWPRSGLVCAIRKAMWREGLKWAVKPIRARNGTPAMARTPVLPEATPVGAVSAQLRRSRQRSASSASRRLRSSDTRNQASTTAS